MSPETLPDLRQETNAVDVSTAETHFNVQCTDVRLFSSSLRPLGDDEPEEDASRFTFKVRAAIQGNTAISHLETQVIFVPDPEAGMKGFSLRFGLVGNFVADEGIDSEQLAEFVRFYTLTIFWPYAREYASDQFRRAGNFTLVLPVINPQAVTQQLIEEDRVEVTFIDPPGEGTE